MPCVFDLDSDRFDSYLRDQLGVNGMDDYASRFDGCTAGCLLIGLAPVLGVVSWALADVFAWIWLVTAGVVALGLAFIMLRVRGLARDERDQGIARRIGEFEARFPQFVFVLTPLPPGEAVRGGWHDLA